MGKIKDEAKNVAFLIGEFFLKKHAGNYKNCIEELKNINITRVCVIKDRIVIECCRPGLLIGRKGMQVSDLYDFLKKEISERVEIHIKENRICQYVFPNDPTELYDDFWDDHDNY